MKDRSYGVPKEVVARLIAQAGGVTAVMALLKLARTRVYAFSDPDQESEISYARVARITEATKARAAAEHLAALAGGVFTPICAIDDAEWHALVARASQANATTIARVLAAISPEDDTPGRITPEEARQLLACVDDQLAVLARARGKLGAVLEAAAGARGAA